MKATSLIVTLSVWCVLCPGSLAQEDVRENVSIEGLGRNGGFQFDRTISRAVLENYLSRSITMEGLLNGRGDLEDNIRMLESIGAKFIGRSLCLWGREANLLQNLERARQQLPKLHAADREMILQACIFEIVTTQVDEVPVPDWAFAAFGRPVEKRNFRYADMLYPSGRFKDHWRPGQSVPDVSRPETKLWFYFLAASYIDAGCEALHMGQTELMNRNDRELEHYSEVLTLIRSHAVKQARRHMVLIDSHVPSGGLVREGQLLMDFHSFPLRIMEVPDKPQEGILKVGFSDGIYGRSKGGRTVSGWTCEHLPYLVEIDNWGASRQPGQANAGSIWIWGYDEITWFAHQSRQYRADWLRYAWDWVRRTDPNGYLQMPGSRTLTSPLDQMQWYYANAPSSSVPDGFGDEGSIRAVWAADSQRLSDAAESNNDDRLGEMVTIPAGSFLMGNNGNEPSSPPAELPQHSVHLPTYQIGKCEVTRGEYRRFIEDGGYEDPSYWSSEGWKWKESDVVIHSGMYGKVTRSVRPHPEQKRNQPEHWEAEQEWIGHGYGHPRFTQTDRHPVVGVTYYEAEAYCKWAGGRLPTEAEWEKAARWDEGKQHANTWPWGDVWDDEKSNNPFDHNPAGGGYKVNQSAPVGSYPDGASPYGCMDMVGNAYEWVADWAKSYPGNPEAFDHTGAYHFVKGGCWDDGKNAVRCAFRGWYLPPNSGGTGANDSDYIGFRVAR